MITDSTYIISPKPVPQKPLVEIVQEICEQIEPKPLFCELPEELRFKSFSNSGSVQTYTITTTSSGASGYGTSTITTTP